MNIRKIHINDYDFISSLVREFFDESIGKYGFSINDDQVRQMVVAAESSSFVAEHDGKVVGVIGGLVENGIGTTDKLYREIIWYVNENYRTCGVRLLKHCEAWCKENNIKHMVVCNMGNLNDSKLERFFNRCGYELFEKQYIKEF